MNTCLQLAKEKTEIIFIAWFKETAEIYKVFFAQNEIGKPRRRMIAELYPTTLQNNQPVFLEYYPLPAKELELVKGWQLTNIPVFTAMDEPLLKHFGSDKIIPLIKHFAMKESEAIEHSYVTESIIKVKGKIPDKIIIKHITDCQEQLMIKIWHLKTHASLILLI